MQLACSLKWFSRDLGLLLNLVLSYIWLAPLAGSLRPMACSRNWFSYLFGLLTILVLYVWRLAL